MAIRTPSIEQKCWPSDIRLCFCHHWFWSWFCLCFFFTQKFGQEFTSDLHKAKEHTRAPCWLGFQQWKQPQYCRAKIAISAFCVLSQGIHKPSKSESLPRSGSWDIKLNCILGGLGVNSWDPSTVVLSTYQDLLSIYGYLCTDLLFTASVSPGPARVVLTTLILKRNMLFLHCCSGMKWPQENLFLLSVKVVKWDERPQSTALVFFQTKSGQGGPEVLSRAPAVHCS